MVIVQNGLKVAEHCIKAANTANEILDVLNRTFHFRFKKIILQLYSLRRCLSLAFSALTLLVGR